MPISRPSKRCAYSHQKMRLNDSRVIPLFTCRYSGVCRYLSNATCQSASERGGSAPMIGCHSVIDRPAWVRRVMPPTTMIANRSAQQASSHAAIARSDAEGLTGGAGIA